VSAAPLILLSTRIVCNLFDQSRGAAGASLYSFNPTTLF